MSPTTLVLLFLSSHLSFIILCNALLSYRISNILKNLQYALKCNALFKRILSSFNANIFKVVSFDHYSMKKFVFLSFYFPLFWPASCSPPLLTDPATNLFITSSNLTKFHKFSTDLPKIIKQISSYFVYFPPHTLLYPHSLLFSSSSFCVLPFLFLTCPFTFLPSSFLPISLFLTFPNPFLLSSHSFFIPSYFLIPHSSWSIPPFFSFLLLFLLLVFC